MTVKLTESMMEDAIVAEPERFLDESGLKLVARQYRVGSYIFDLLFEDRRGAKLIVEIQLGTLDRNHTYKILDYYDEYKAKQPGQFIDLMVVANRIPYERRHRLSANGISWREIPVENFLASISRSPAKETPTIGVSDPSCEAGPPGMDKPHTLTKIHNPSQRSHNPMADAPEAFRQFQKQTTLFLAGLEKIEPPVRITVDGRNVRPDNPGNWFSGFSPVSWGSKIGTGSGTGYGGGVGVGYGFTYTKNSRREHFMRLAVGIENPFRKDYRDNFRKEASVAIATQKIPLPSGCQIWPDTKFDDFGFRGTSLLECQPMALGEDTWSEAIKNYSILNKGFDQLIGQLIRKYSGLGAFQVDLDFG
ncbi:MAG: hypothetical protein A2W09_09280 [Deltaproteobacteria bacterium RBG_16_50_11]|nr:MAG: hypothetical protein A2W09_09280 [Deltaproteobacteria bacterium RBG_16_50_11]